MLQNTFGGEPAVGELMRSSRPPIRNGCLLIRGGRLLLRRTEGSREGTEREGIPPQNKHCSWG